MNPGSIHPIAYFSQWFARPIHVTDWSVLGVIEALNSHPMSHDENAQDYIMPLRRCREHAGRFRIYGENQDTFYCFVYTGDETKNAPPVYFESCLDFVDDYGLNPADVIEGDHVKVADTFSQFLWHILGHHICVRMESWDGWAASVSGIVFNNLVTLDKRFENPLGCEFPAGYSPYFSQDTICIPDWGAAFLTPQAAKTFLDRFAPSVSRKWA